MTFYDEHNFNFAKSIRQWLWKRRLKKWLSQKYGSILDLGCGCGVITELFRHNCKNLNGCDVSIKELEIAKSNGFNINYFKHDIDKDSPLINEYNLLISIGVLHHTKKGVNNLSKYGGDKYVIALYHKGFYSFIYKFLKGKDWFKHTFWQDLFTTPIVHFYSDKDIPKCFKIISKNKLWFCPLTVYELEKSSEEGKE